MATAPFSSSLLGKALHEAVAAFIPSEGAACPMGVTFATICNYVGHSSTAEVRFVSDRLVEDGDLCTTLDADHLLCL